ncbi:MAG: hypothetical protein U1B30_12310 [Pseudomonadota bacterium]|jgi:hypothetical protein|nr:hypothetical protein [Pseudomonadota bacterium]
MSILDRFKKNPAPTAPLIVEPAWVLEGTRSTKELFQVANAEAERIRSQIKSGECREVKIVLARVAKVASKSRSLLHPRRQPELCDWIERANIELAELAKLHTENRRKLNKLSKRQLENELSCLRKHIKAHSEAEMRLIVEEFFSSNLLDDRDKLVRENSRLRMENADLIDKITKLQAENRGHILYLGKALNILTPSQQASLLELRQVDT